MWAPAVTGLLSGIYRPVTGNPVKQTLLACAYM